MVFVLGPSASSSVAFLRHLPRTSAVLSRVSPHKTTRVVTHRAMSTNAKVEPEEPLVEVEKKFLLGQGEYGMPSI